jgi:nicotinamidase/pyrazinamidase
MHRALLIIDVQTAYLRGRDAVVDGAAIIPVIDALVSDGTYTHLVATKDIEQTANIGFGDDAQELRIEDTSETTIPDAIARHQPKLFYKGQSKKADAYSGFKAISAEGITLPDYLASRQITAVDVVGLSFDYCVRATAIDAVAQALDTRVLLDATRPMWPSLGLQAMLDLRAHGVTII